MGWKQNETDCMIRILAVNLGNGQCLEWTITKKELKLVIKLKDVQILSIWDNP